MVSGLRVWGQEARIDRSDVQREQHVRRRGIGSLEADVACAILHIETSGFSSYIYYYKPVCYTIPRQPLQHQIFRSDLVQVLYRLDILLPSSERIVDASDQQHTAEHHHAPVHVRDSSGVDNGEEAGDARDGDI